ncbi:large ribosomal subunit protein eL15-like [Convolutriloba macropyga]|uniref:large ribosomal subunit protein eL15-like n=1 Tax=Convolutriloba macropyga TaxID=536237 RepID=UPI003F51BAC3
MGAAEYQKMLWRKKQSDTMRYILRMRAWHYRQLKAVHRVPHPSRPDKARMLGYKAKQGFVIYRARVRRGGFVRHVAKGQTMGKPTNQGVHELKLAKSHQAIAEKRAGKYAGALRILNSYWVGSDGTYKYFEVIMIDPMHPAVRKDPKINWIVSAKHKHRECRGLTSASKKSRGLGKGIGYAKTIGGSRRGNWKRRNTLQMHRYR